MLWYHTRATHTHVIASVDTPRVRLFTGSVDEEYQKDVFDL